MTEKTESEIVLEKLREMIAKAEDRREAGAAQVREADAELRRLRTAERALAPTTAVAAGGKGSTREAALAIMQELGKATQFEVAQRLGTRKNNARTALTALVDAGLVRRTGTLERRSPVFAMVEEGDAGVA